MTTNQEGVHAAVRAETGTSGSYLADWNALFDANAIATGPWGPRLLAWINQTLGTSYTDTAEAMQAFAVDQGFTRWNDMNTLVLASSGALDLLAGNDGLALDFTDDFYQADTGFYGSAAIVGGGTQDGYDTSPDTAAASLLSYPSASVKYTMGPSGTLRFGAHNLALRSEDITASPWDVGGAVDTSATVMTSDGSNGYHFVYQGVTTIAGATYAMTVRLSAGNYSNAALYTTSGYTNDPTYDGIVTGASFDLTGAGSVLDSSNTITATITSVGGGEYDCTIEGVMGGTSPLFCVGFSAATTGAPSWDAAGTETINVLRTHIRRTPSDSTYLATGASSRVALPFEWSSDGTTLQGIRVEEARTNLCLYSDDLTNAAWTKSNMTTAKTATGPDGVANSATTCTATAGNATALQAITSGSAARVTSVYLKRRTGTGNIDITQDNGSTWTTQAITSSWARYSLSAVTSTNPTVGIRVVTSGDAVDVALFDHEVGSFITSPIPTIGSTVTRASDNISLGTGAFPTAATQTFFIEAQLQDPPASFAYLLYTGVALLRVVNSTLLIITDGVDSEYSAVADVTSAFRKIALAGDATDATYVSDGDAAVDYPALEIPTVTQFRIGSDNGAGGMTGLIKRVAYFPARKSNADLQVLTGA